MRPKNSATGMEISNQPSASQPIYAACSGRLRDAPAAKSSSEAQPASATSIHIGDGMLSRRAHDQTVFGETPNRLVTASTPARFMMSA
jgi:hypothetical protein